MKLLMLGRISDLVLRSQQSTRLVVLGGASVSTVFVLRYLRTYVRNKRINASNKLSIAEKELRSEKAKKHKIKLDREFFRRFYHLLKLMIPGGLFSKEGILLVAHSATLIARTFLSVYVAVLEGKMVKAIVLRDMRRFIIQLLKWLLIAVPATFINSLIRYFESTLAVAFRSRLVEYFYRVYFDKETYYRISNLDSRLANPDECLTEDIAAFAQSVAHLYSHLTKPILDIVVISYSLVVRATSRGASPYVPPFIAGGMVFVTHRVLRAISPRFGYLIAEVSRFKGKLRYLHSRVIANSEEIAFYGGHQIERQQLSSAYGALRDQMQKLHSTRIFYVMMEQFLMKYCWSAAGMMMVAIPTLQAKFASNDQTRLLSDEADGGVSERTRGFTTAKNLLASGADAVERLLSSYKEIAELAGYTSRVWEMYVVFGDVSTGKYQRTQVSVAAAASSIQGKLQFERWDVRNIKGEIIESDSEVSLENVPIVTPTGDVIVRSLSIKITSDMHVLITGPNGCGKSSLFRILGGLWPVYDGKLTQPKPEHLFYIPQRPYMSLGTLRDQLIYPMSTDQMPTEDYDDPKLESILRMVHLEHILEREGGWNARSDWMDVLSGGEKQRVGLARVFYHRPKFALLDECTSAVSIDVESKIYQSIKDASIQLLTVTHRPSLWKFHTHLLQFDGEGNYRLESLTKTLDERLSYQDEKEKIELQLAEVPKLKDRLGELCTILGSDSVLLEKAKLAIVEVEDSDDVVSFVEELVN